MMIEVAVKYQHRAQYWYTETGFSKKQTLYLRVTVHYIRSSLLKTKKR